MSSLFIIDQLGDSLGTLPSLSHPLCQDSWDCKAGFVSWETAIGSLSALFKPTLELLLGLVPIITWMEESRSGAMAPISTFKPSINDMTHIILQGLYLLGLEHVATAVLLMMVEILAVAAVVVVQRVGREAAVAVGQMVITMVAVGQEPVHQGQPILEVEDCLCLPCRLCLQACGHRKKATSSPLKSEPLSVPSVRLCSSSCIEMTLSQRCHAPQL